MVPSDLAAARGEPSYVWRAGQQRRLEIIARWAQLDGAHVLVDGCGVGMYAHQIQERYAARVTAFDIEEARVQVAAERVHQPAIAAAEALPYPANQFDTVLSHEVLEHVADDRSAMREMVRVTRPGGRMVIFAPNRWYPFETHGHYWRGRYHFGNTPLINYLPTPMRDRLAPHVRAYTRRSIVALLDGLPVKLVHAERIYGGYDNLIARIGKPAAVGRDWLYRLEGSQLDTWGLSHLVVVQKLASPTAG
jgi:SAM-dependent methyltransferase